MNVARSAITATIALAGDEGHEVQPVRPDVADGAQRAAPVRLEPPVPVGVEEQPVLEVAAGHEPDVAEPAAGDELVDVLVERVEADVEVDRVDEAARGGRVDELGATRPRSSPAASRRRRAGRRRGSPCACGTWRSLGEVTWTTSTRRVGEQLVERRRRRAATPSAAARAAPRSGRAAEDAADLDADPAQRLDVDGADEAGADDGGADVGDPRSCPAPPPACGAGPV